MVSKDTIWLVQTREREVCFFNEKTDFLYLEKISYSPLFRLQEITDQKFPQVNSLTFIYCKNVLVVLKTLLNDLKVDESNIFLSLGLGGIVLLNFEQECIEDFPELEIVEIEIWKLKLNVRSCYEIEDIVIQPNINTELVNIDSDKLKITFQKEEQSSINSYLEQIQASLLSLARGYSKYYPTELVTLYAITDVVNTLFSQCCELKGCLIEDISSNEKLKLIRQRNSKEAIIIEICAALSYCYVQGLNGQTPILENKSPFPHFSLLGIGLAIRGTLSYIRQIESKFSSSALETIYLQNYLKYDVEVKLSKFKIKPWKEEFSPGYDSDEKTPFECILGRAPTVDRDNSLPLLSYFSLRQGFKESNICVSSASEALNLESRPQWTINTLSHEVMHSRVRLIQNLIMKDYENNEEVYLSYMAWLNSTDTNTAITINHQLQHAFHYFCFSWAMIKDISQRSIVTTKSLADQGYRLSSSRETIGERNQILHDSYSTNQNIIVELLVHYHDLKYIYGFEEVEFYLYSIVISWSKVKRPYSYPEEYFTRLLIIASVVSTTPNLNSSLAMQEAIKLLNSSLMVAKDKNYESPLLETFLEKTGIFSKYLNNSLDMFDEKDQRVLSRIEYQFHFGYWLIKSVSPFFDLSDINFRTDKLLNIQDFKNTDEVDFINPVEHMLKSQQYFLAMKSDELKALNSDAWYSTWNYIVISSQLEKIIQT